MRRKLKFQKDGSFKIVQLTDLHFGSLGNHENRVADDKTFDLMNKIIQEEAPDLVVVTGDLIWSEAEGAAETYHKIMAHMSTWGIPFAIVYGNHDSEANITREELFDIQRAYPNSIAERGPKNISGVGNYTLTVHAHNNEEEEALLYFLDSGDYAPSSLGGYGWVQPNQVGWFVEESRKYAALKEKDIPALAFFHIPTPEYQEVLDVGEISGNQLEEVCCPKLNSGLFTALLESGNVMGTFVGHDHDNDYCAQFHGISLCYGRITGYNVYGVLERGARVIQLFKGENRFESWLRLDTGEVAAHYSHQHK